MVSAHLDDAVLGTANLLAAAPGGTVVTVFAGKPETSTRLTPWDEACSFTVGDDVVEHRRDEDLAALAQVGFSATWLDYLDAQYAPTSRPEAKGIAGAIASEIRRTAAQSVLMPLGIGHQDHQLVATAGEFARRLVPTVQWFAYADLPYAYEGSGSEVELAISALTSAGTHCDYLPGSSASRAKRKAISCYQSQLRGLGRERHKRLARRRELFWYLDGE